jgi:hypothetical protein
MWNCNAKVNERQLFGTARYSFVGGYSDGYFGKPKALAYSSDKNMNAKAYNEGFVEGKKDKETV